MLRKKRVLSPESRKARGGRGTCAAACTPSASLCSAPPPPAAGEGALAGAGEGALDFVFELNGKRTQFTDKELLAGVRTVWGGTREFASSRWRTSMRGRGGGLPRAAF